MEHAPGEGTARKGNGVVQIETNPPRRISLRSTYDPRWLVALTLGVVFSLGYYAALIWIGVTLIRWIVGAF